jgi:hypothetical protein
MNGYLLDTNIVTAHLKQQPGVRQRIWEAELAGHPVRRFTTTRNPLLLTLEKSTATAICSPRPVWTRRHSTAPRLIHPEGQVQRLPPL